MLQYIVIAYLAWLLVANITTAILYVWDKRAAQSDQDRVPERKLLLWSLVGGWPAALTISQSIRHKTSKLSFRIPFIATIFTNIALHCIAIWCYFALAK